MLKNNKKLSLPDYPIDIVVPWVDGSDPNWQAERSKFRPEVQSDSSDARYREWGLFQYWFRSIEEYAPWVRTVHLVTWGHLPSWLNINHPKLHIVNHKDYIPAEYLPTFSSHTIELNMHRIPGLAEHFIYFNDDVYLNFPTEPKDFFVNGLPVDTAVLGMVRVHDNCSYMPYINLNMLALINSTYSKSTSIKRDFFKWFNLRYGKDVLYNIYFLPVDNAIPGFRNYHTCNPYCKKTLEQVWEAFPKELDSTCRHRFRSREDVNQYLFRYWHIMRGEFTPHKPNSVYLTLGHDGLQSIENALYNRHYKVVCVNDDPMDCDFNDMQRKICQIFQTKYTHVSSFEIADTAQTESEALNQA